MINIEVPFSTSCLSARRERVVLPRPQLANDAFTFSLESVGGVIKLDTSNGLQYQIVNGATGLLSLHSSTGPMRPIDLSFDAQLFPSLIGIDDISSHQSSPLVLIVGLTATGTAFFWHLDTSNPAIESSTVRFMDLSSLIKPHGIPTSIGGAEGSLVIGCSDGSVLSVPMHPSFHSETGPQVALELPRPHSSSSGLVRGMAGGINRILSGVIQGLSSTSSGHDGPYPVSIFPLPSHLVLVIYSDCSIRAFSLPYEPSPVHSYGGGKRGAIEVFSDTLTLSSLDHQQNKGLAVSCAFLSEEAVGGEKFLVVGFESSGAGDLNLNSSHRGGGSNLVHRLGLFILSLSSSPSPPSHSSGGSTPQPPKVSIIDKKELTGWPRSMDGPQPSTSSFSSLLLSSCSDGRLVWCLFRAQGSSHVVSFDHGTGIFHGSTLTLDHSMRAEGLSSLMDQTRILPEMGRCDIVMMVRE